MSHNELAQVGIELLMAGLYLTGFISVCVVVSFCKRK